MNRTSLELYRDCLRLVHHIAPGRSPKAMVLRQTVRRQFKQHMGETNDGQIESLKANAIRALSNYMLYQSAQKDDNLQKAMTDQVTNVKRNKKSSSPKIDQGKEERDESVI
jgi:Complex 1 protein (LYR family)